MNTALLILSLVDKYGPAIGQLAQRILYKATVEEKDWSEFFSLLENSGESYFPTKPAK